jgi:gluconate 5-dehydrogenase
VNDTNPSVLKSFDLTGRTEGAVVYTAAFDVTHSAAVVEGVGGIEAEVGPIDILVNNAGMQRRARPGNGG